MAVVGTVKPSSLTDGAVVGGGGGGGVGIVGNEEEPAGVPDWLDLIYITARFAVLFFIIYFYSSFFRFAVIITVSVLIYL